MYGPSQTTTSYGWNGDSTYIITVTTSSVWSNSTLVYDNYPVGRTSRPEPEALPWRAGKVAGKIPADPKDRRAPDPAPRAPLGLCTLVLRAAPRRTGGRQCRVCLMLDLKYRPRRFADVLGNKGVVKLLLARSRAGTLAEQSMMFGGPKGCGKTSLARIVARAIVCTSLEDGEPCGTCQNCVAVLSETSPDVEELDAASQGTVDKVRTMVRDAEYGSLGGNSHIYLVDEAQRLSAQAQDAFLKAVEDRSFIVILCTTEPQKIKTPIRSRVEEYPVQAPPPEDLVARLAEVCAKESVEAAPEALQMIVKVSENCPRSSLIALTSMASLGPIGTGSVRDFFRFGSLESVVKVLGMLDESPRGAFQVLDELSRRESPAWIRDSIVSAISSALRVDVGARPTFPVHTGSFFQHRNRGWLLLARSLGNVDRPTMADVEAILFENCPAVNGAPVLPASPTLPHPVRVPEPPPEASPRADPPLVQLAPIATIPTGPAQPRYTEPQKKPEPRPELPKAPVPSKTLEIDGIKFSSMEELTSLDKKVEKDLSPPPVLPSGASTPVELDKSHAPIPEKEFVRGLVSRVRGK
jgi:DNA polymerase III subunit gamma/tau